MCRTCSISKAKVLRNLEYLTPGRYSFGFDTNQILSLPLRRFYPLPQATRCFQFQIYTSSDGQQEVFSERSFAAVLCVLPRNTIMQPGTVNQG